MEIRHATAGDMPALEALYAASRAFMAASGNPTQWGAREPSRAELEDDLKRSRLYVCEDAGAIAAVFMFTTEGEPLYDTLEGGAWLNDAPYGVVHRIATGGARHGAGAFCLEWCFEQCGNLRIDTHCDNIPMQRLLKKLGFARCGVTRAPDGTPRLAFQKAR